MKILINFDSDKKYKFDFDEKLVAKRIVKEVLDVEKIKENISLNISIVNKLKIKKLNRNNRNIDKVTDVLSFPNVVYKKPSKIIKSIDIMDLSTNTIYLGDIVLCYDKIISQSKEYNHSVKREYSFLIAHSMLHLLGYDHMVKEDEIKMFKKQDIILDNLKIKR